jgi:hypothetical protein
MEVVIIPFEYEKLSPAEQTAIVPICIKSTDEAGNPIDRGWFEAVARVQDPLRTLAKFWLDDVWRVSEITEAAVHTLWCRHGSRLGREPSSRVYAAAKWQARDRSAGGWHSRRRILKTFGELETVVRERVLVDPKNYGRLYEDELFFKDLAEQLNNEGLGDVSEMLKLVLDGLTWKQIGREIGKPPDPSRIRFGRWVRRIQSRMTAAPPAQSVEKMLE